MWTCPRCEESLEDQFDSCWKCAGEAPQANPTKPWVWRWLIALLFVFQVALVFHVSFPPTNLARVSFRREERAAALMTLREDPSPENKAVMRNEWRLASHYVARRQLTTAAVLLGLLFGIEALVFYFCRHRHVKTTKLV
jgi:hypothetical protein